MTDFYLSDCRLIVLHDWDLDHTVVDAPGRAITHVYPRASTEISNALNSWLDNFIFVESAQDTQNPAFDHLSYDGHICGLPTILHGVLPADELCDDPVLKWHSIKYRTDKTAFDAFGQSSIPTVAVELPAQVDLDDVDNLDLPSSVARSLWSHMRNVTVRTCSSSLTGGSYTRCSKPNSSAYRPTLPGTLDPARFVDKNEGYGDQFASVGGATYDSGHRHGQRRSRSVRYGQETFVRINHRRGSGEFGELISITSTA